jgi:hypothetical protein
MDKQETRCREYTIDSIEYTAIIILNYALMYALSRVYGFRLESR